MSKSNKDERCETKVETSLCNDYSLLIALCDFSFPQEKAEEWRKLLHATIKQKIKNKHTQPTWRTSVHAWQSICWHASMPRIPVINNEHVRTKINRVDVTTIAYLGGLWPSLPQEKTTLLTRSASYYDQTKTNKQTKQTKIQTNNAASLAVLGHEKRSIWSHKPCQEPHLWINTSAMTQPKVVSFVSTSKSTLS